MKDQKDKILNALLLTAIAMLFVGAEVAVWFGVIGIRIAGTAIIAGLAIYTFDYLDQEREEKMEKFRFKRREDYKQMKSKDRDQMERAINGYCESYYQKGIEAGKKSTVYPSEIAVAISGVKGVGKKKREEIMECLTKLYEDRMKGAEA